MLDYYNARLNEYEAIYQKPERQIELEILSQQLINDTKNQSVLEISCGTGWWTAKAAPSALHWTASDLDEGALQIAQEKKIAANIKWQQVDALSKNWTAEKFDIVFAAHWFSHLLFNQQENFCHSVKQILKPNGRLILLDNAYVEGSSTPINRTDDKGNTFQLRQLNNGDKHEVLKNFYTNQSIHQHLESAGLIEKSKPIDVALRYFWYINTPLL